MRTDLLGAKTRGAQQGIALDQDSRAAGIQTPANGKKGMNAKEVTRRNEVTCESPLPGWMPNCALSAKKWASSDTHRRAVVSSIRVLFVIVALLLVADLHSSTLAAHGQWEMNPFLAALAEHVGTRAALLGVKVADLAMLAGLYALWRRSNAHVPVTLVLIISAFEYAETVMNNYQG